MKQILAPLQSRAFWRGVIVFLTLSLFVTAPIHASVNGMGGKVEICTGFGVKWIDIDEGEGHQRCDDCVAVAPLVVAVQSPKRQIKIESFSFSSLHQASLIASILDQVSNKDPPLRSV